MWLTPHPRDLIQPEGERERIICHRSSTMVDAFWLITEVIAYVPETVTAAIN